MTAPVSTAPNCRPRSVTTGIRLFRKACRMTARAREAPRARAACTYCSRSSSSSVARVMRARIAASAAPSEIAGRTRCARRAAARNRQPSELDGKDDRQQRPQPEVRNRDRRSAPASSRAWSIDVPRHTAAAMPSGMENADRDEHRRRRQLERRRQPLDDRGRSPAGSSEATSPGRPRSTPPRKLPYCSSSGRSRPRRLRSSSTSSCDAVSPSIACAGSPGMK